MNEVKTVDYTEDEMNQLAPSYQAIFYGLKKQDVIDITNGIGLLEKLGALNPEFIGKENRKKAILLGLHGRKLNFSLIESLNNMMVIRNKVSLHTDAGKILVFNSGKCEYLTAGFDEDKQQGWCTTKRTDLTESYTAIFSIEDAKTSGLISGHVWKKYTKRMCINRATWFALRDQYADILAGTANVEEQQDIQFERTPSKDSSVKDISNELYEKISEVKCTKQDLSHNSNNIIEGKMEIDNDIKLDIPTPDLIDIKMVTTGIQQPSFEMGIEEEK